MKAFLDTNILIDFLLNRGSQTDSITTILQLGASHSIELLVSDLTIANIAYITRRDIPQEEFYETMIRLQQCYSIIPIGSAVVNIALHEKWNDFEDSLQFFSALQADANCIITNNAKDFTKSTLPVMDADAFIKAITE